MQSKTSRRAKKFIAAEMIFEIEHIFEVEHVDGAHKEEEREQKCGKKP